MAEQGTSLNDLLGGLGGGAAGLAAGEVGTEALLGPKGRVPTNMRGHNPNRVPGRSPIAQLLGLKTPEEPIGATWANEGVSAFRRGMIENQRALRGGKNIFQRLPTLLKAIGNPALLKYFGAASLPLTLGTAGFFGGKALGGLASGTKQSSSNLKVKDMSRVKAAAFVAAVGVGCGDRRLVKAAKEYLRGESLRISMVKQASDTTNRKRMLVASALVSRVGEKAVKSASSVSDAVARGLRTGLTLRAKKASADDNLPGAAPTLMQTLLPLLATSGAVGGGIGGVYGAGSASATGDMGDIFGGALTGASTLGGASAGGVLANRLSGAGNSPEQKLLMTLLGAGGGGLAGNLFGRAMTKRRRSKQRQRLLGV